MKVCMARGVVYVPPLNVSGYRLEMICKLDVDLELE